MVNDTADGIQEAGDGPLRQFHNLEKAVSIGLNSGL